jgi:hypothetical protein
LSDEIMNPPSPDPSSAWFEAHGRALAEAAKAHTFDRATMDRRRRTRGMALAVGLALVAMIAAGAVAAARGLHVFGIGAGDRDNATYVIDVSSRYDGPAPERIACLAGAPLDCRVGTNGELRYALAARVSRPPEITVPTLDGTIDRARAAGSIGAADAERLKEQIAGVSPAFLQQLQLILQVGIVSASSGETRIGPSGVVEERVPPPGAARFLVCTATGALRCTGISGAAGIAIGAPIYELTPGDSWVWVQVPAGSRDGDADSAARFFARVEEALGRPLAPAERRAILVAFGHVYQASSGSLVTPDAGTQESGSGTVTR